MTYKIRAGAPFDPDNLFNIPAIDAGPFVNPYPDTILVNIDFGSFSAPNVNTHDGGYIPLVGTATYDPSKSYGPNDIIMD